MLSMLTFSQKIIEIIVNNAVKSLLPAQCYYQLIFPKVVLSSSTHFWCKPIVWGCWGFKFGIWENVDRPNILIIFILCCYLADLTILTKKSSCSNGKVDDFLVRVSFVWSTNLWCFLFKMGILWWSIWK